MATLHMEVETARNTNAVLQSSTKELLDLIIKINSNTAQLQSAWIGNSATEFFGEVDRWTTTARQLNEELSVLATRLANEVSEWENMASKLA